MAFNVLDNFFPNAIVAIEYILWGCVPTAKVASTRGGGGRIKVYPEVTLSSPEGRWDQRYPTPRKDIGPEILYISPERTWYQGYPTPPSGQTNACENITFPQLRWRLVTRPTTVGEIVRSIERRKVPIFEWVVYPFDPRRRHWLVWTEAKPHSILVSACALDCDDCLNYGPGKCDPGKCSPGFYTVDETTCGRKGSFTLI